jgi:hypothetical protein
MWLSSVERSEGDEQMTLRIPGPIRLKAVETTTLFMAVCAITLIALATPMSARAQALPTAGQRLPLSGFIGFGGSKTHVAGYFFNSLGVTAGLTSRITPRFGVEVRGATYPIGARFVQSPVTAGLTFQSQSIGRPQFFAYAGGGGSYSQNATAHYVTTPARWSSCWQVSTALEVPMANWRWRVYDATWTETYSSLGNLQSIAFTSGLSYSFGGNSSR